MDIPMLIEHLCNVFTYSPAIAPVGGAPAGAKTQETLVTFYFSSLMKHSEELNNKELLAKAREQQLLHLAVYHVLYITTDCPAEVVAAAAEGFSAMADNE